MLGNRRDTVIGGEGDEGICQSDFRIHEIEQLSDLAIHTERYIHHFLTVWPITVTDVIVS